MKKENELIAEFLGYVNTTPSDKDFNIYEKQNGELGRLIETMSMKFHSDWNWLMKVVEKIEILGSNTIMGRVLYSRFVIEHNNIILNWSSNNNYQLSIETLPSWKNGRKNVISKEYKRIKLSKEATKIEAIYATCIEFIKWYNQQTK